MIQENERKIAAPPLTKKISIYIYIFVYLYQTNKHKNKLLNNLTPQKHTYKEAIFFCIFLLCKYIFTDTIV